MRLSRISSCLFNTNTTGFNTTSGTTGASVFLLASLLASLWLFAPAMAVAEDTPAEKPQPEKTPADESDSTGEVIIDQAPPTEVVEELRVNGQLYAIRVTPKHGIPYYLVDSDGDGNLETRKNDTDSDLLIPAWVIKRW